MVDPISEEERSRFRRRLKVGVALLVGASAGLVTLQADPTAVEIGGAVAAGLAIGYALAWFVVPSGPSPVERQRQRREGPENPFADGGEDSSNGDDQGDTEDSPGIDGDRRY